MLVLDANILIRAVLGSRVLFLLRKYSGQVEFLAPDAAFQEAREHLPGILGRRGVPVAPAMLILDSLEALIQTVESGTYARYETLARQRIDRRDEDDWPILASALALGCPIWTEDTDFFGCGVATWTSDRVELYLAGASSGSGVEQ
jgi:predicted nucleic acid-binding protein